MGHGSHGSWVTWVMGQELNASLGSWVTFPALSTPPRQISPHRCRRDESNMRGRWEGRRGERWKAAEKPRFLQTLELWGSCAYPRSLIRAKFGVQGHIHTPIVYSSWPNFALIVIYSLLSQFRIIWPNFKIYGQLLYPPRSPIRTEVGVRDTHGLYAYMSNFIRIGLLRRPWRAKIPEFYGIFIFNFLWWRHAAARDKFERGCASTHLPLSNGMKSISILKRFDGEVVSTSSTVRKRDGRIEKKNKKCTELFRPRRRAFF